MTDILPDQTRPEPSGAVAKVIGGWALAGGVLLLLVVLLNVATVLGALVGLPVPGDFELTEMGVAVAAFTFLPYCQLIRSNVTADIFTQNARPRTLALLNLLASMVALLFAVFMAWRMYAGLQDQKLYGYETSILQVPIWWAYLPVVVSLVLLAIAATVTMIEDLRNLSRGGRND